jgi:hypothetical protein
MVEQRRMARLNHLAGTDPSANTSALRAELTLKATRRVVVQIVRSVRHDVPAVGAPIRTLGG